MIKFDFLMSMTLGIPRDRCFEQRLMLLRITKGEVRDQWFYYHYTLPHPMAKQTDRLHQGEEKVELRIRMATAVQWWGGGLITQAASVYRVLPNYNFKYCFIKVLNFPSRSQWSGYKSQPKYPPETTNNSFQ
jgi:hypothetical protein